MQLELEPIREIPFWDKNITKSPPKIVHKIRNTFQMMLWHDAWVQTLSLHPGYPDDGLELSLALSGIFQGACYYLCLGKNQQFQWGLQE